MQRVKVRLEDFWDMFNTYRIDFHSYTAFSQITDPLYKYIS